MGVFAIIVLAVIGRNYAGLILGRPCGEPLDSQEVANMRKPEIGCLKQMPVHQKVPLQEPRDGGHDILGVIWVDAKEADAARRSTLLAT